jgi:hypothetical protein
VEVDGRNARMRIPVNQRILTNEQLALLRAHALREVFETHLPPMAKVGITSEYAIDVRHEIGQPHRYARIQARLVEKTFGA